MIPCWSTRRADPEEYKVFCANAGDQGELPNTYVGLDTSHRRKDLEPSH